MHSFSSVPINDVVENRGVYFPRDVHVSDIIVTGPPGSGKTPLVRSLGGWPIEGYLNLASNNWWRSWMLAYHPREVHLGFPCPGHKHGRTERTHPSIDATTACSRWPTAAMTCGVIAIVVDWTDSIVKRFRRSWMMRETAEGRG